MNSIVIMAGATGNLGSKIAASLVSKGAHVKALVRYNADSEKIKWLQSIGVTTILCDMQNVDEMASICRDSQCFISAISGLGDAIIDTQKVFLQACLQAGVPRFIPSDFCSDFTNLTLGNNRNLDFRKVFHDYINTTSISATSIFNGAFMELTTGEMPLIMFDKHKILHWGNKEVFMDFTHTNNIAEYTALVALDNTSPRYLKIAGERISAKQVADLMTNLTGTPFKLFRPGGIRLFNILIQCIKFFSSTSKDLYPAWQGMQYMRDMMEGKIDVVQLDNVRHSTINWIGLKKHLQQEKGYE
jgi:nucleoside-diphosphate-sugar epimerase